MNKIQKSIQILSILGILGFTIYSCEQNDEAVGYGLLNNGEANANRLFMDLISYNLYNGDSIRSDESVLPTAVVGVYSEDVFGKVKASYVTQMRLPTLSPVFSDSLEGGLPKATVDSVVLYFTPSYSTDSEEVDVDTLYVDELGVAYDQDTEDDVDTFRIVTKYPISNKYGNASNELNLKVHTVSDFLYSTDYTYYSNRVVNNEDLIGQGTIGSFMVGIQYKNSSNSTLDSINGVDVNDISPSVRIPLDATYFQNKIINAQGSNDLVDQSRFIQYIKGIKLSTEDDNAFLLNFNPSGLSLRMYYNYVKKKDDEGNIDEGNTSYLLNLASAYNVRMGLYERDASLSPYLSPYMSGANTTLGDDALYLDGLGGFKTVVQFPDSEIAQIKSNVSLNNWSIVGARLKFYKHPLAQNLEDATRIFAYKYNEDNVPVTISEVNHDSFEFIEDLYAFSALPGYSFNPSYDSENDYYEINITEYFKNIVEKDSINYPIFVEMGNFTANDAGQLANVETNNKAYNPFRMVFKGNTYTDEERLRLEILYADN